MIDVVVHGHLGPSKVTKHRSFSLFSDKDVPVHKFSYNESDYYYHYDNPACHEHHNNHYNYMKALLKR